MNKNTYAAKVVEITGLILEKAKAIRVMEQARYDWTRPEGVSIHIGQHHYAIRKDGTVNPTLEGVQREVLAVIDSRLQKLNSELEGLRFKLVTLGREGGAS